MAFVACGRVWFSTGLLVVVLAGCTAANPAFGHVGDSASETQAEPTTSRGDGDSFESTSAGDDKHDDDSGATTAATSTSTTSSEDETAHGVDDGVHETGESEDTGESNGEATGNLGGCVVNDDCQELEYCNFPDGLCGSGQAGSCVLKPEGMCPAVFAPVCGCDEKTYENACEAAVLGVAVKFDNACE
jgi:hypothetical protein